jgi:hypothetical protein
VKIMLKQQSVIDLSYSKATAEEHASSYVYHELADGRLVPIEMGGLVELALLELGGQLVDVVDEYATPSLIGLN